VQSEPSNLQRQTSSALVLRFAVVLLFSGMLLSLLARYFLPLDTALDEDPARLGFLGIAARLSDIVGICVWLLAIVLATFDYRDVCRRDQTAE
jgi:hypothetical protein